MIEFTRGDLLRADVDALVNTVNTVGAMGKGIALQFRRAYPDMFKVYQKACKAGELEIGKMHVWPTGLTTGPKFIINFPTKQHWRGASKMSWIDDGLSNLVATIQRLKITSIAVPPLGAGNGGLPWGEVKSHIESALTGLNGVRVLVFEPVGAPAAQLMAQKERRPLTLAQAAVIRILDEYLQLAWEASQIEVQKLMYFLKEAGEPISKLVYKRSHYGPYADNLRHVLDWLEGMYISGYGDASKPVLESDPITLLEGAAQAASEVLAQHQETQTRINRVITTTQGYDSMYGMELLATVHWAATYEIADASDSRQIVEYIQQWSERKKELFTEEHITRALKHLRDQDWLAEAA